MTQQELVGVDISFEKNVIESGEGVRQRALAIQALVGMAERIDAQVTPELVEKFRGLTKKEAVLARKAIENLVQFFGEKPVEDDVVVEAPAVEIAPLEPALGSVPALEVAIEDEPEDFATPAFAEIQNQAKPLTIAVQKWLKELIDDDIEQLTEDDIPSIVNKLMELRGPMRNRVGGLNYQLILTEHLKGQKQDEIANLVGSTHSSIGLSLNNYKKHILKTKTDAGESKEEIVVAATTPKPPVTPATIRPLLQTKPQVIAEVPEHKPEPIVIQSVDEEPIDTREERLEKLIQAVDDPNLYSLSEWLELAEEHIRDITEDILTPEQTNALWQHIHLDEAGEYRLAPAEYQTAIELLRSRFRKFSGKNSKMSHEQKALRTLFNVSMGYKNLDDVYKLLSRSDVSVRPNWVQRVVVAGFAMVAEEDE